MSRETIHLEETAEEIVSAILNDIIRYMGNPRELDPVILKIGSHWWSGLWTFEVSKNTRIYRLKVMVLRELHNDDYNDHMQHYMLTCRRRKKSLLETNTIAYEHLKDGDILELVATPVYNDSFIQFSQRISEEAIHKATQHLPKIPPQPPSPNIIVDIQPAEFKCDVRKIMVTLIEHSLTLMSMRPNARYIFNIVRKKLLSENFYVDTKMLSKYESLGASPRRLRFAINASYNDEFAVNTWIDEVREVPSEEMHLTYEINKNLTVQEELEGIKTLYHQYMKLNFQLCAKAIDILLEMGFNFDEICAALRYTGNNIAESVVYLVGERDPDNDGAKPGLVCPLSPTSDLYKEIMEDPEIVLPLFNPSVLYAFLSVVDSSSFFLHSMRVPLIAGILNKIVSSYYSIRCAMAMRQMKGIMPNE